MTVFMHKPRNSLVFAAELSNRFLELSIETLIFGNFNLAIPSLEISVYSVPLFEGKVLRERCSILFQEPPCSYFTKCSRLGNRCTSRETTSLEESARNENRNSRTQSPSTF